MKCLILAGGFGTRLGHLAENTAKPLLALGPKPVISHIVDKVPPDMDIIVSINKRFESEFLEWRTGFSRDIDFFVEDACHNDKKLGALKSVHQTINIKEIREDLLVIAGDNFFDFDIYDFLDNYDGTTPLVAIYDIKDRSKARLFGVARLDRGRIVEFYEKPSQPVSSLVAIGCYLLPVRIFEHLSDCCTSHKDNLGEFITYLINREDVSAYTFQGSWFDIGTVDAYEEAKKTIATKYVGAYERV